MADTVRLHDLAKSIRITPRGLQNILEGTAPAKGWTHTYNQEYDLDYLSIMLDVNPENIKRIVKGDIIAIPGPEAAKVLGISHEKFLNRNYRKIIDLQDGFFSRYPYSDKYSDIRKEDIRRYGPERDRKERIRKRRELAAKNKARMGS